MQLRVEASTIPEKLKVDISSENLLNIIAQRYWLVHKVPLNLHIEDGMLMRWELVSSHNNEYEWEPIRPATSEEIERYAFWCQIKELFGEV